MLDVPLVDSSSEAAAYGSCCFRCCRCCHCATCNNFQWMKTSLKVKSGWICPTTSSIDIDDIVDVKMRKPCYSCCASDMGNVKVYYKSKRVNQGHNQAIDKRWLPFLANSDDSFSRMEHAVATVNNHTGNRFRHLTKDDETPWFSQATQGGCMQCFNHCCAPCESIPRSINSQFIETQTQDLWCGQTVNMIDLDNVSEVSLQKPCCHCCISHGTVKIKVTNDASLNSRFAGKEGHSHNSAKPVELFVKNAESIFNKLQELVHSGDARRENMGGDEVQRIENPNQTFLHVDHKPK